MRAPETPPEFCHWSLSDGYILRGRVWRAAGRAAPLGIVYLHGIQSHGAWFEWSASVLAAAGCPVILPDRRGSGLNDAERGDAPAGQRWLQDLDELADWARRELGVERFGLVGVSWGGKLAAAWARRRAERVERLLLIAPGIFPAVDVGPLVKLRVGLSLLRGGRGMFEIPLSDPALFTDNPAGRAFITRDARKLTHVTARFLWCSRQLDRELAGIAPGGLNVTVTLALAGRDRIIRNRPTAAWLRRVSAQTPVIKEFTDSAHTLEFETDVSAFAAGLRRWISGRSPTL